jgi:hypothetical protein
MSIIPILKATSSWRESHGGRSRSGHHSGTIGRMVSGLAPKTPSVPIHLTVCRIPRNRDDESLSERQMEESQCAGDRRAPDLLLYRKS